MPQAYMQKGWTFKVISTENDGDYRMIFEKAVNLIEEAHAIAALIELFNHPEIGNLYEPSGSDLIVPYREFRAWAQAHQAVFESIVDKPLEPMTDVEVWYATLEIASDLGLAGQSEFTTRSLRGWNVFYSPVDVYLNNVTDQFKKAQS